MSEVNGVPVRNAAITLPTDTLIPTVQKLREEYDTAGLTRNNLEAAWRQTVETQGADSVEAKVAKYYLDDAQLKLEQAQAKLRDAIKLPAKPSAPEKAPSHLTAAAKASAMGGEYGITYRLLTNLRVERLFPAMSEKQMQTFAVTLFMSK